MSDTTIVLTLDDPRLGIISPDGLVFPKVAINEVPFKERFQVNTMSIDATHFYAILIQDTNTYEVTLGHPPKKESKTNANPDPATS